MSNRPVSVSDAKQSEILPDSPKSVGRVADFGPDISLNYSLAKVIAIFTVVAGHWFSGTILWVPVTFGLFIFAFSSAYFTSKAYGISIDRQQFWRKKLERLGLRYWVIMAFLSALLLIEGKPVLHWHSLVHFAGMSGLLNWFSIPNRSSLGAGLWFFTLLLLFYLAYPYLANICKKRTSAGVVAIISAFAALILDMTVKVGHELWLTALGFVLGIAYGLHEPKIKHRNAMALSAIFCGCLILVNLISAYKRLNPILIFATSVSISVWISKVRLPASSMAKRIARLEVYLLEIFLIHTYLFVHVSGNDALDFLTSVLLIVVVAAAINRIVARLSSMVFAQPAV